MYRVALPVLFGVVALLGLIGWAPTRSEAQSDSLAGTPALTTCDDAWESVDVRPHYRPAAVVNPVTPAAATPTIPDNRELYIAVITLPAGGCTPFDAPGNQRDGAVVLLIQQGKVEYIWLQAGTPTPGSLPVVRRGDLAATSEAEVTPVIEGTPQTLFPGDWITQDRKVKITIRNIGGDSAIILKGAFAKPPPLGGGCGGDCK